MGTFATLRLEPKILETPVCLKPTREHLCFNVVVVVANKQYFLQDFDPEKRKMISRTLRFIAHSNGAHLQVSEFISPGLSKYVMSPVLKRF